SIPSSSAQSVNVSETSANPTGLRVSAPLKITSAISSPRSDLADCSPSAQRTASRTFDFPQPFGPTIAVTPSWKLKTVLSANDLKPNSSSDCKCILGQTPGLRSLNTAGLLGLQAENHTIRRGSGYAEPQDIVDGLVPSHPVVRPSCNSHPFESTLLGALSLTRALALNNSITHDAPM